MDQSDPTQKTYDYVLVAHQVDDERDQKAQRQKAFIQKLEEKNITVKRIEHDDKVFFGIRAPNEMFKDYQYLLKVSDSCNWCGDVRGSVTQATRIRIVHFILHQTFINTGENLEELIKKGVFETMFCLHE
ncbi:anoctamin-9-like, partial [Notothenia coriiceps]|uniref:Anoctamin-9-like n=1 Tax=Notothenia coriiceps TaxID=8208 RepID=A0A6I9NNY2_9TELE